MQAPAVLGAGMAAAGEAGWRGARGGTGHRSAAGPATVTAGYGGGGPLPLPLRPSLCPSVPSSVPLPSRGEARAHAFVRNRTHKSSWRWPPPRARFTPRPLRPGWGGLEAAAGRARGALGGALGEVPFSPHLIPPLLLHRVRAHTHVPRRVRICVREPASDGSCSPLHRTVGGSITILPTEGGICGALFQP